MKNKVIEIKNLSYTYPDGTTALNSVSVDIFQNERTAIIGANGAGKSTLMLHLNGIISINKSISICGLPVIKTNIMEIRKKVGMIFQNPDDQLFCLNVFDDVAFGPRNLGIDENVIKKRVSESLSLVGLDGYDNRNSFHLSTGEKKRVAIATVLSMEAEILAFDEPTASLDPKSRREFLELIKSLRKTQIIITHDLNMVKDICDRVIVLHQGQITADGTPEEIVGDQELLLRNGLA